MTQGLTLKCKVDFRRLSKGRQQLRAAQRPTEPTVAGRVPRITRLMALAIRLDRLLRDGTVGDQAELARLGYVSRARITQILNLLQLAPDIQEALLFLPRVERGRDPILEWQLRPIAAVPDWRKQRRMWQQVVQSMAETHGLA